MFTFEIMNMQAVQNFYQNIIDKEKKKLHPLKKKIFIVAILRLLVVLFSIILCYLNWNNRIHVGAIILISLLAFILLLKFHNKLFYKKKYSLTLIKIANDEYKALHYDFTPFDGAPEYIQTEHSFSYDLDLFGHM